MRKRVCKVFFNDSSFLDVDGVTGGIANGGGDAHSAKPVDNTIPSHNALDVAHRFAPPPDSAVDGFCLRDRSNMCCFA